MVLGFAGYSHQVVPHNPRVPNCASLHCAHIMLFFLFHLPTFTCSSLWCLVPLGVWDCLRSAVPCPCHVALGKSHLKLCSLPGPMVPGRLGVILGMVYSSRLCGIRQGSSPVWSHFFKIRKAVISLLFYASNISKHFRRSI